MSGVHLRRRVTKTGQTRWMVVYRVGGRYGRIRSAGTFPTRQLARARAELSPHDLRHRWISLALRRGVPLAEVAAAAGHARQSVTADTYSHVVLEPGDLEPVAWETS